jgi:hypothetical protein
MDSINLIAECARVPSFSTGEQTIHPFIIDFIKSHTTGEIEQVYKNNLVVSIQSHSQGQQHAAFPPVALTAHLDKINHFGETPPGELPVSVDDGKITGQLDDAAGLGICLFIASLAAEEQFPPLLLLFSEMEENGPYVNPYQGMVSGLGAARISQHLLKRGIIPSLLLTIDTTPFYRGVEGVSLYSRFWEKCKTEPSDELVTQTRRLEDYFLSRFPVIEHQNNTNDYITYGRHFNRGNGRPVPSIALEPAIFPYHTRGEGIFLSDIHHTVSIIKTFLTEFPLASLHSI